MRKIANFAGDYGEAPARFPGVSGFYGSVKSDQPGLLGDGENLSGERFDLVDAFAFFDSVVKGAEDFRSLGAGDFRVGLGGLLHGVCAGVHVDGVLRDSAAFFCNILDIQTDASRIIVDQGRIARHFLNGCRQLFGEGGEAGSASFGCLRSF